MLWQSNNFHNWIVLKYKKDRFINIELKINTLEIDDNDVNLLKTMITIKKNWPENNKLLETPTLKDISIRLKNKKKRKIIKNLQKFSNFSHLKFNVRKRRWRRIKRKARYIINFLKLSFNQSNIKIVGAKKLYPRDFFTRTYRIFKGVRYQNLTKQQKKNWRRTKKNRTALIRRRALTVKVKGLRTLRFKGYQSITNSIKYSYKNKKIKKNLVKTINFQKLNKKKIKRILRKKFYLKKLLKKFTKKLLFSKKIITQKIPRIESKGKTRKVKYPGSDYWDYKRNIVSNKTRLKRTYLTLYNRLPGKRIPKKKIKAKFFKKGVKKPVISEKVKRQRRIKKLKLFNKILLSKIKIKKFKLFIKKKKLKYLLKKKIQKYVINNNYKKAIKQTQNFLIKKKIKSDLIKKLWYKTQNLRSLPEIITPFLIKKIKKKIIKKHFLAIPNKFLFIIKAEKYKKSIKKWKTREPYLHLNYRLRRRFDKVDSINVNYLQKMNWFLHKIYFKKKKKLPKLINLYKNKKKLQKFKKSNQFHNNLVYYLNTFYNIQTNLKKTEHFTINNYLFLNKFSLENYMQQFYLVNFEIQNKKNRDEKKVFFFNFRNKKLKTYRSARKTHWSVFTTKTLKEKRYQKFLDIFLKKTKQYYFEIFTYFQFKFEFSYQFWSNFNHLYQSFYKLTFSYKKILQFPVHLDFWVWIDRYKADKQDLELKIIRWQEKKLKIRKTFWMQQKKKIPNFFKKKIFNIEGNTNTIQYDFVTNYFIILKKFVKPTHTNLFIFKNKYLKLHGFKYNS